MNKYAVDFCVRTLYNQICGYARFINEAPGHLDEPIPSEDLVSDYTLNTRQN